MENTNLGKCLARQAENESVRNLMMLDKKSLEEKGGWSCFVCHLPPNGAVAVLCDDCLEKEIEIKFACLGYPGENRRIEIEKLTEVFEHDMSMHEEEIVPITLASSTFDDSLKSDSIEIEEAMKIGENDYGYQFGVCRLGHQWHGFALGTSGDEKMLFFLPQCEDDEKTERLIKLVGAVAQNPENGYGGIKRWFVEESLRGTPDDFRCEESCEECGDMGCMVEYHGFY